MARPKKCRRICREPSVRHFAPDGPVKEAVILNLDELECIRLLDLEGMTQEQCANQMQVARPTVTAIYEEARRKLAEVLVRGKALEIQGGSVRVCEQGSHCCGRCGLGDCGTCPRCGTENQE